MTKSHDYAKVYKFESCSLTPPIGGKNMTEPEAISQNEEASQELEVILTSVEIRKITKRNLASSLLYWINAAILLGVAVIIYRIDSGWPFSVPIVVASCIGLAFAFVATSYFASFLMDIIDYAIYVYAEKMKEKEVESGQTIAAEAPDAVS